MNFADYLGRRARQYGDRVAFVDGDRSMTFCEFDDRSNRFARLLQSLGTAEGERVAVFVGNTVEFFEISFGIQKAAMAIVYVNHRLTSTELSYQLTNSGATALVVAEDLLAIAEQADLSGVRNVIVVDESYEARLAEQSADRLCVDVDPDTTCILVYTSGTTGKPKGAQQTHGNWFAYTAASLVGSGLASDDRVLVAGPIVFSGRALSYAALYRGATQHILRVFDPPTVLKAIEEHRITAVMLVPTIIYMILETIDESPHDISSLRLVQYGGAPIAPEKLRQCLDRFGESFVQIYGLSESPTVAVLERADHWVGNARLASAGRPAFGMEVSIQDDDNRERPIGEMGEICVRGPIVGTGYWQDQEKTDERLIAGWLHTGDVGYIDESGYIFIVDRRSDMIITGGFNVYPREIEDVLCVHPAIAEVAVVSVPDDTWGELVVGVVRLSESGVVTADELTALCRERLAGYKVPKHFVFSDEPLPKSSHGKLLRREVRAALTAAGGPAQAGVALSR